MVTSPDSEGTEGVARSTKPLLVNGRVATPLRMRFEGARPWRSTLTAVPKCRANSHLATTAPPVSARSHSSTGAAGSQVHIFFHQTLLDENAASHIAVGRAFGFLSEDPQSADRINISAVHNDFTIGPGVRVSGRTRDELDLEVLAQDGTGAFPSRSSRAAQGSCRSIRPVHECNARPGKGRRETDPTTRLLPLGCASHTDSRRSNARSWICRRRPITLGNSCRDTQAPRRQSHGAREGKRDRIASA